MEAGILLFLMFGVVTAGLVGLIVWLAVVSARRARERQQGMAGFAHHKEWEYRPADPSLVGRFHGAPFGRGHSMSATNVLLGHHDGRPFVAFDYRYTTTSGSGDSRSSSTHTHSVIALNLGVLTPGLSVAPTGTFGRLVNAVTGRDITVGDPAFDQAFTVTSHSPEFARDVLHPGILEVVRHHPHLAWRFENDSMLVIRSGEHTPQEVEAKLHFMDAILDRLPPHVLDRLRGEAPR